MKELNLVEIKTVAFDVLLHFKEYCEENDLKYYLSNGTLLGAIKYKGFIPWDDDVDVFMPRTDYDKFISLYEDSMQYKLHSIERSNDYRFPFAKLCDMSTLKYEENIDNGNVLGVDIDIFPLDVCTAHIFKKSVFYKLRFFQIGCILSKLNSFESKSWYKRVAIKFCKHKGYKYFLTKLCELVKGEGIYGKEYKGCLVWPIYGKKEIIPAEVFDEAVEVEFEGEKFSAPRGYDIYLRSLYGNFEEDPPKEKQKSHHKFKAYRVY